MVLRAYFYGLTLLVAVGYPSDQGGNIMFYGTGGLILLIVIILLLTGRL